LVGFTYNTDTTLQKKVENNYQETKYTYDSSKRITEVQRYPGLVSSTSTTEDQCQRVNYTYGSDPTAYNYNRLLTTAYGSFYGPYYDSNGAGGTCTPGADATTYLETYSYHPAGGVTGKTLALSRHTVDDDGYYVTNNASVNIAYAYDSAGRVLSTAYPTAGMPTGGGGGPVTFTYGYDTMGRPAALTDDQAASTLTGSNTNWVQNVAYDYAGRMTSWQRYMSTTSADCGDDYVNNAVTESLTYNATSQTTWKGFSSSQESCYTTTARSNGIQYVFSTTGSNNGQIMQAVDSISGETITYTYDALKRLTEAASTPNTGSTPTAWTQTYAYDGFGNLTATSLNGGTNPIPTVDPTTNRFSGGYDTNGNMLGATVGGVGVTLTYDEANRLASAAPVTGGTEYYGYAPDNKRIYRRLASGGEQWTLYGARGEKVGVFEWIDSTGTGDCGTCALKGLTTNVWFAGKMIWSGSAVYPYAQEATYADRLGTNRADGARFYPYGDEIGGASATGNDHEKFGTYNRDGLTKLDYGDQRYYASSYGRFNTPDPMRTNIHLNNPGSWNSYAYGNGDPVGNNDRRGLSIDSDSDGTSYCDEFPSEAGCEVCDEVPDSPGCSGGDDGSGGGGGLPGNGGGKGVGGNSFLPLDNAKADLNKPDCYGLLGFSSASAAQSWVTNSISISYVQLGFLKVQNGAPVPSTPPPAQTSGYGTIYINTDYNWANFASVSVAGGGTFNYLAYNNKALHTNMTSDQLATLIIIHELQHNRPGGREKESAAEKLAIYNDCIK
jgi:RHS repeat-associated protein